MLHKLTEEEENEYIKAGMAEGLIPIYTDPNTPKKLKQKILEELFDRLVRLETLKQAIENRKSVYYEYLERRGYFDGDWNDVDGLAKNKNEAYALGVEVGVFDVCEALLKMMERKEDLKVKEPKATRKKATGGVKDVKPCLKKPTGAIKVKVRVPKVMRK